MAVKAFTLAQSQLVTYRKRNYDGEYTYSESVGTGRVGTNSGSAAAYERRVWCDFSGVWDESITSDKIDSVKLTAGLIGEEDNTDVFTAVFRAWNGTSVGDTDEQQKYTACGLGESIGTTQISANTTHAPVHTIAGDALAQFLVWKTISIAPSSGAEIDDGTEVYADVSAVSVEVTYRDEEAEPVVSGLTIAPESVSGNVMPYTAGMDIQWDYYHEAGVAQGWIDIQMRSESGDWVEVASKYATTAQSYTVSPYYYPEPYAMLMLMHLRIRAYSAADVPSEWQTVGVVMAYPDAYALEPGGGDVVLGGGSAELRWKIRCLYGDEELNMVNIPSLYDVQYTANAGETWTDLLRSGKADNDGTYYSVSVPENSFAAGPVQWRVRPVVAGHRLANWSQESFIIRVQASTSSVSCDGKPHPTVSWSASSQIAYQVRFADYDSGAVYGSAASHTIPYVYADGAYPVQVRTQAADGTWSPWTELEYVTIRNTAPAGSLMLTAVKTRHAVALEWSGTEFGTYILYRNGIPVYIGSGRSYTDVGANGNASYYVRGIVNPNYLQSNTAEISAVPATDCMYDLVSRTWIPLKYSASPRARGYSETANVVYKYYAGRKYPVAYVDGTAERQLNVSYVFKTMEDADRVRAALGHTVIYKDTRGRRIIGIFGTMGETVERRLVSHTIGIVQVDYNEEVRYET